MKRPTRKAINQRNQRRRYAAGTISPPIPVTPRHAEALRRRAMAYGGATTAASQREWVVREVVDVLDRLADEYGLPE